MQSLQIRAACIAAGIAFCFVSSLAPASSFDPALYENRIKYQKALNAVRSGRVSEFKSLLAELENYPLHPYLIYHDARRQIQTINTGQVLNYRTRLANTPLDESLFQRWLVVQGRRHRWTRLATAYNGSTDIETQCYYLHALLHSGKTEQAMQQVPRLWVVGKSQHKACDPVFSAWIHAGHVSGDLAWDRLRLALESNSRQLARYLLRFFSEPRLSRARQFYEVHATPSRIRTSKYFPDDRWGREALLHGLRRYARSHLERTKNLWVLYKPRYSFEETQINAMEDYFDLLTVREGEIPKSFSSNRSSETIGAIIDAAVSQRDWKVAERWLTALPSVDASSFKWRYWRGRVQRELGIAGADQLLSELANERTYYGFAAASLIGKPPAFNEVLPPQSIDFNALKSNPGVARIIELFAVGDVSHAKQEWAFVSKQLTEEQKSAVVAHINEVGWTDQAIFAANTGGLGDLVSIRFPVEYERIFRKTAFLTSIDLPYLLGIARQESAFMPKAKSRAGALGVMQLMPATAKATARRALYPTPNNTKLLDPDFNIPLGGHHIAELMQEFNNHRVLVASAYNAGKGNANRWLKQAPGTDTLAWIERITYFETRDYVKNVLAFSLVYAHRLGLERPFLYPHELTVP